MKYAILYTSMLIFLVVSCQEEPILRFGFDTDFDKNSQGQTSINVSPTVKSILFTGDILLSEGELVVELKNPSGDSIFRTHLKSPVCIHVNESFASVSGDWALTYKSFGGTGRITLHLNIE